MPAGIVLDASYVGTRGVHLVSSSNINQPMPTLAVASGAVNVNAVRPYPGLAAITTYQTNTDSHYHSLQVSANRRLRNVFRCRPPTRFPRASTMSLRPATSITETVTIAD